MKKEARYHLGVKIIKSRKIGEMGKKNDNWKWIVNESA